MQILYYENKPNGKLFILYSGYSIQNKMHISKDQQICKMYLQNNFYNIPDDLIDYNVKHTRKIEVSSYFR